LLFIGLGPSGVSMKNLFPIPPPPSLMPHGLNFTRSDIEVVDTGAVRAASDHLPVRGDVRLPRQG